LIYVKTSSRIPFLWLVQSASLFHLLTFKSKYRTLSILTDYIFNIVIFLEWVPRFSFLFVYTVFSKSMLTQTGQICLLAWHSISKSRLDSANTRTGCVKLFLPIPKAMEIINNSSVSRSLWFVMEPIGKSVINMFSPITMACLGASMWLRVKETGLMGWLRQFRLQVGLYCFPLLLWLITPFMLHTSPFYLLLLQYPTSYRNVKFSVLLHKCAAWIQ